MTEREDTRLLWRINKNLEEISYKLDRLISLYQFSQQHELERLKQEVLGRSKIRREVYDLCDGTKTVRDIARRTEKSIQQVSMVLSTLEEAGLIKSRKVGRKKYYIRTL